MGLFSKKKKENQGKVELAVKSGEKVSVIKTETPDSRDMVAIIKAEQGISNPFTVAEIQKPKSVAKTFGTKYKGIKGVQLASSKVVDVRSYKKPEPKPEVKEKTEVEKELERIEQEESEAKKEKSSSFFDDLIKRIEEEGDDEVSSVEPEPIKEESIKPIPVLPKKEPPKVRVPKPAKKKKSIDIDIISGDFGGSDII